MTDSDQLNATDIHASPLPKLTAIHRDSRLLQTRIFIIGQKDFALHGMASLLEAGDDSYLVSCVEPDAECMAKFETARPDALLIQNDSLPDGYERFLGEALQRYPAIRILVFGRGMSDDHLYNLVRAGVHGYINERMDGDHLQRALEQVLQGNCWVERHIQERFIADQHRRDAGLESQFSQEIAKLCERLTRRETEILCEVIKGLAIKQIAEHVHLSHQGVKMHLAKLFRKFNVSNRNQLILATFDAISPVEDLSVLLRDGLNRKLAEKPGRH